MQAKSPKRRNRLLTVAEAAALKKTTRYSIHRWMKSGLRFRWLGHQRVIESPDLDRFIPRRSGRQPKP